MAESHEYWMNRALNLAAQAAACDEVPVGAILVLDGKIIGQGFNAPIRDHDPTAHAEIIALRQGANAVRNYRLLQSTLYVTLEPCLMCAGAMVHARIKEVVYGATDPKAGSIVSQAQILQLPFLNHRVAVTGGVLAPECGAILTQFFRAKRNSGNE